MSNLSSAILRFLIAILLFSASTFSRCNLCSAAGFSESSSGVPEGRGSLPSPNCTRKFWMTASRSCRAERISFAGEMSVLVHGCDLTEALALITLPLLFLRRGALLHSDTSMLAICGEEEDVEVWKRNSINIKMRSKGEVDLFKSIFIYGHSFSHLGHGPRLWAMAMSTRDAQREIRNSHPTLLLLVSQLAQLLGVQMNL